MRAVLVADNAVWLPDECSSLRRFRIREKIEFRVLVKSKLLLNRKELESVFYMKKLRLIDTFPTVYRLDQSDKWIKKFAQKCLLSI